MAKPLEPIEHSDEEEKKRLEDVRAKEMKKFEEILAKAQQLLDKKNLEELIESEVIRSMLMEELKEPSGKDDPLILILREVIDSTDRCSDEDTMGLLIKDVLTKKEAKNVNIEISEERELYIFCNVFLETSYEEYEKALKTTKRGKVLFLKRRIKERWVNNYNPEMIYAWNANMDIQLAFDPYAVVTYIVSYMNKDENQMSKFMMEALRADTKQNAREKLKTLKMAYLTHRQVGIAEATYRLIPGMYLKKSDVQCIFVMSGFPKNRSKFWSKIADDKNEELILEEGDSDNETENNVNEKQKQPVKLPGKSGTYQEATTIHDRYASRPRSVSPNSNSRLENMCLAQFAISYTYTAKLPKTIEMDENGCSKNLSLQTVFGSETCLPNYIKLENDLGYMRLRTFPQVLRIHSSKRKEGHEQHYSELVLFTHWRNEIDEFFEDSMEDCIAQYQSRRDEIISNRKAIYPGEDIIELLENGDLEYGKPEHFADILDCQGEQNNEDDNAEGSIDDPEFESISYMGNLNLQEGESNGQVVDFKYKKICLPSSSELKHMTRKLVPEQMNILRTVVSACKSIVRARKNPKVKPKPVRMIVHGGAGNNENF